MIFKGELQGVINGYYCAQKYCLLLVHAFLQYFFSYDFLFILKVFIPGCGNHVTYSTYHVTAPYLKRVPLLSDIFHA